MYSLLLAGAIALLVGGGGTLLDWWHWGWGIPIGLLAFVITWIVIARRFMKRLQPGMQRVQRQAEAQMWDAAMETLEDMLSLGNWIPMLRGQIYAQMGTIAYGSGQHDRAVEYLSKATRRSAEAQMMLAAIRYRNGEKGRALKGLEVAAAACRKHAMLHNVRAWLLHKEGRTGDAMAALAVYLKRDKDHKVTKDNLLRLQNDKRMTMSAFGMQWYMLGFERPPREMGQMQQAGFRKGFRQPPKKRGS